MKKLKISANITFGLAILSAISLILLFLALTDIGHDEPDVTLEWHVAGICMMVIGAFIVSVFVTLVLIYKNFPVEKED